MLNSVGFTLNTFYFGIWFPCGCLCLDCVYVCLCWFDLREVLVATGALCCLLVIGGFTGLFGLDVVSLVGWLRLRVGFGGFVVAVSRFV